MLHIAPEYSLEKRLTSLPTLRYTTADLDSPLADMHVDIMAMPFGDEAFDVVLCNHVLEHV
ncbi:MAG: class I SAM-dependent methyltransferase, partial [Acidobacteria bacterium]|nr:class I SAM-dependent methyltransferase [Acidobacteriota bacterium]